MNDTTNNEPTESTEPSMTALQTALIALGFTSIQFKHDGTPCHRAIADSPDVSIVRVLRYGKRMLNDAANGATDKVKARDLFLRKFDEGKWGSVIRAMDPYQTALHDQIVSLLRQTGMKAKDANELAKKDIDAAMTGPLKMAPNQVEAIKTHCKAIAAMTLDFTVPAPDLTPLDEIETTK